MSEFEVKATLTGDSSGAVKAIEETSVAMKNVEKNAQQAQQVITHALGEAGVHGGHLLKEALHTIAGPALALFSIEAVHHLYEQMRELGEEARQSETRFEKLAEGTLKYKHVAEETTKRIDEYAKKTSESTGIDKEQIMTAANKIMMFDAVGKSANVVGGTFDRVLQASLDLQGAGFGGAAGMARMLGKAMEAPATAAGILKRMNIVLTQSEKDKIKVLVQSGKEEEARALILARVEKKVHGMAEATAMTSAKMQASWKNLKETIGKMLLPTFDKFGKVVQDYLIPALSQLAKIIPPIIDWFIQSKNVLISIASAVMTGVLAYKAYNVYLATSKALMSVWTLVTKGATVAQQGLNLAMESNPIGLVIGAVSSLIALFVTLGLTANNASNTIAGIKAPTQTFSASTGQALTSSERLAVTGTGAQQYLGSNFDAKTINDATQKALSSGLGLQSASGRGIDVSATKKQISKVFAEVALYTKNALKLMADNPTLSLSDALTKAGAKGVTDNYVKSATKFLNNSVTNFLNANKKITSSSLKFLLEDPEFGAIINTSSKKQREMLLKQAGLTGEAWAEAFIKGGENVDYTGILQDAFDVKKTQEDTATQVVKQKSDAIKTAKDNLKSLLGSLAPVALAIRQIGNNEQSALDSVDGITKAIKKLYQIKGMSQDAEAADLAFVKKQGDILTQIQRKRDEIQTLIDQSKTFIKDSVANLMKEADITKLGASAKEITDNLDALIKRQIDFNVNLKKLSDMGLNKNVYSQLLQAGSEAGGATASAIIAGGSDTVKAINDKMATLNSVAQDTATASANVMYGAGQDISQGLIDGLQAKELALYKAGKNLAKAIKAGLNDVLSGKKLSDAMVLKDLGLTSKDLIFAPPASNKPVDLSAVTYNQGTPTNGVYAPTININGVQDPTTVGQIVTQKLVLMNGAMP